MPVVLLALLLAGCGGQADTPAAQPDNRAAAAAPAAAPEGYHFPALTGRVVDAAHLMPEAEQETITAQLATLEQQTGHQLVVVTVPSLDGHAIEDYGVTLGRTWGIGRRQANDGVLLIVAPNEHKVRIEVGYGLEKALKDEEAMRIIRDDILPRFSKGDFPAGIDAGVAGILREIGPEAAP